MHVILGVILHFIGGFASGSFYIPYKKVKNWAWESYWIVGGLFSWLIVPPLAAWLTAPGYVEVLMQTDKKNLFFTYLMGVFWGIGGLTFGLTMRYLGLSLGMAIVLGFCSALGTLVPPIFYEIFGSHNGEKTIFELFNSSSGLFTLLGVVVCLIGIGICGKAGVMKEKELSTEQKQDLIKEFNFSKGLFLAILSGFLSSFMSFGFQTGKPIANAIVKMGTDSLWQNNPVLVVILLGGLTSNLLYCLYINYKNKTFSNYTDNKTPLLNNYLFSAIAGTTWYLQFFFYGMGESLLSKTGFGFSSWTLHMAFIIIISNFWGLYLKEWRGSSKKTLQVVGLGIAVVIFSTMLVGYGNYLASR